MLPGSVAVNSVQFEMESWTGVQRAFAVKSFYKNNESCFAAQREFRKKFGIHRKSKVPSAHAIKTWVNNFEETGSTLKQEGGSVKTVRTPQNIDGLRASFEQSPRRSAVRHSKKLCYVSTPLIHLFLQMLKYVLPYKCNCIMISNTFNSLTPKNRPIRWRTLYIKCVFAGYYKQENTVFTTLRLKYFSGLKFI